MRWQDFLACPKCMGDLSDELFNYICVLCGETYFLKGDIVRFDEPPDSRREWAFETARYDRIAKENPKTWGLAATYPDTRNAILKERIGNAPMYLNIGQGFGGLEEIMPEKDKVCLDQSLEFLRRVQEKHIPATWLVQGYAERMPLKTGVFLCVVSDSVFQTVVDQKEFLFENARVLARRGKFLMTIAYKWNYPRKPQQFPVTRMIDRDVLKRFLHELGIEANITCHNLSWLDWRRGGAEGKFSGGPLDFMVVEGTKE